MKNILLFSTLASAVLLSACGGGSNSDPVTPTPQPPKPAEYVPSQYKSLSNNFKYVQEPLTEIQKNQLYDLSYWVNANPLVISSYSYLYQSNNNIFKTKYYATNGASSNTWREDSAPQLVFNIAQNKWVETNNDLTMTQGPVGTEGIRSLYVQSDAGVKYFTLTEKDLSGLTIAQGVNQGFGNGIPLPEDIKKQSFSSGAKAYAWVQDITQPVYNIRRTHYVFSNQDEVHPIYTCNNIGYCSSPANSLEKAIENKAWYQNTGKTGSIRLNSNQTADVIVYDAEQKKNLNYNISYNVVAAKQGVPKHILFTSKDKPTTEALKTYFSAADNQLAWFEYNNQVVSGSYALPVKGLQSTQYSYNKIAVNDILTKWTPKKNPVLE